VCRKRCVISFAFTLYLQFAVCLWLQVEKKHYLLITHTAAMWNVMHHFLAVQQGMVNSASDFRHYFWTNHNQRNVPNVSHNLWKGRPDTVVSRDLQYFPNMLRCSKLSATTCTPSFVNLKLWDAWSFLPHELTDFLYKIILQNSEFVLRFHIEPAFVSSSAVIDW